VAHLDVFGGIFLFHLAIDGLAGEVRAALGFGAEMALQAAAAGALGVGFGGSKLLRDMKPPCKRSENSEV